MTAIWGHRGASGHAPENTLPAFALALEQGADGIELDVQLTSDGEVVVIHDRTLERTTDGTGRVVDHTLADLRRLDASRGWEGFAGARIPLLAEVLELVVGSGAVVNIELKNGGKVPYRGLEERVLAVVADADASDRVVLSTFNHYSLRTLQGLGASMPLGALYSDRLYKPWKYVARLGADCLHPPVRTVRERKVVTRSHELGLKVHVWTVNTPADLERMGRLGVDAVITDVPDVAHEVLR